MLLAALLLLVVVALLMGKSTPHSSAQSQNSQQAFSRKADKLLKRIVKAADEDRIKASKGTLDSASSEVDRLARTVGVDRRRNNQVIVDVAVKLSGESDSELKKAGFDVSARVGDMATVSVDVNRLTDLASLESVSKIFGAAQRHPSNDRAKFDTGVENVQGQRLVDQRGRGVIVAVIDSGIDFRHADFTVPGSGGKQTRIKALLDMTVYGSQSPDPGWAYVLPGKTAPIGRLYSESDINAALQLTKPDQNSDSIKQRDKNGHGTHVTGTAAGNGLSSPSVGTYSGIAPEADLIIVKASRQNDQSASFRNTDIINALQFVQQKAAELNKPFVVNLSLGSQLGSHDGTSPDERAIDNLVNSGPGRAVVVAAGNEGNSSIHASGTVPAGGSLTLDFKANGTPGLIDLYHSNADRFRVTITRPDGVTLGPVSYDENGFASPEGQASDQYLQVFNTNDNKGDSDPANDQPDIFLVFKSGAPTGVWKIDLQDADSNPNQAFDAWAEGDGQFTNNVDNFKHLVASPGNAREAITVGAYVTRSTTFVYGSPWPFTSPGPTADGRLKPEISAPGYYLYSSRSTDVVAANFGTIGLDSNAPTDSTHYTGLAGTSMATPVVVGAVALLLEKEPNLTNQQIKETIKNTARPGFSSQWDSVYGFGKLNIAAAVQLGSRPIYTISGQVFNGTATRTVVTLTRMSSGAQISTQTDISGKYYFNKLPSGDTYTLTPSRIGPEAYVYSPATFTVSNLSADTTVDFTESVAKFSLSGHVRNANGTPLSGISLKLNSGSSGTTETDANGFYSFSNLAVTTYDVRPFSSSYTFNPGWASIQMNSNKVQDFIGTPVVLANPIDQSGFFVTQQYMDFLGRQPDATGLDNWVATLNGCPNGGYGENDNPNCDRVHISAGFFLSEEFRGRGYWAYRFYETALDRRPSYEEFIPDMARVGGSQSPESEVVSKAQYIADFVQRPEFKNRYDGLSNAAFLNALEQNAEIAISGKGQLLSALDTNQQTRAQVLRGIVESKAVEDQFYIRAFVAMQYFGYLRRNPDTIGYDNWVNTLTANPGDYRHMIFGFLYSTEYRSRFGS
jgi:subtilisin family serine protease